MSNLILGTGNSGMMMIVWMVVIFVMLYFLMIRPQKKQMEQRNQMLDNLEPNTRVVTVGGITGVIRDVSDEYIYVEIAEGLVVEMTKQGIATILDDDDEDEDLEEDIVEEDVVEEEKPEAN